MMSADLLKHYKKKHLVEQVECPICGTSTSDLELHKELSHHKCPSCLELFDTVNDLQKHMSSSCVEAKMGQERPEDTRVVALGKPNTSLNLDNTNTEQLFNGCLMKILDASNLTEEEKDMNRRIINKHTSESLLAKNRLTH